MTTAVQEQRKSKTYDMVYISIFTVIIAVCSWISVPMTVPVTLQTFGVFAAVGILRGRRGTMSVMLYIHLGAVGLPVFSGFSGGIGRLTGNTGGYIVGFLFSALLMWGMEKLFGKSRMVLGISMVLGLLACYTVGTVWFMTVYAGGTGSVGLMTVLGWCVFPFVIPDLLKIAAALLVSKRVAKAVKNAGI